MADLIERYKITANLPSVLMNYCNRFNSKQLELITEMIYELENSIESADVQPIVYAHKTINVGRRSYCSNCGKLAIMENFCSKCGAKVEDGDVG